MRREYDTANFACPELVKSESKVKDFLIAEGNDPEKAAIHIANYWKSRKNLFGNRWLLRMTQTGSGALDLDDLEILRSGFMVILPRPSGGYITLRDEGRLPRPPGISVVRVVFYMYTVFPEMGRSSNSVLVHIMTSARRPPIDLQHNGWKHFYKALPVLYAPKIYVVQAYEPDKMEVVEFNAFRQKRNAEYKSGKKVELIAGDSLRSTINALESRGFERRTMPRCFGGHYDYSEFDEWIRTRMSVEDYVLSSPLKIKFTNWDVSGVSESGKPKRRSTVVKKLVAKKHNEDKKALRETCRTMSVYKDHLSKQNKRLEDALFHALKLVSGADPITTKKQAPETIFENMAVDDDSSGRSLSPLPLEDWLGIDANNYDAIAFDTIAFDDRPSRPTPSPPTTDDCESSSKLTGQW